MILNFAKRGNDDGHFQNNSYAYSLNNITSTKTADGPVAMQFGGADGKCGSVFAATRPSETSESR
jgi:hypothetical protein